ncbi:MAG: hypothetical protein SFV54_21315, partial [Bryobacteraceae bacterium]|nr:hypothetical protein [Bryobacteraceae bacterium]
MSKSHNRTAEAVAPVPHSWAVKRWPESVYPHEAKRGAWLVRSHRTELLNAGALVRIGRELVVMGAPYSRFMQRHAERVGGYK